MFKKLRISNLFLWFPLNSGYHMTIPIADASGTKEINHHKEIPIIGSTGIAAYTSQDNKFPNTI